VLGSSGPGAKAGFERTAQRGCKGGLLSRNSLPDSFRQGGLQCPISTLPPAMGTKCGRREREADAGERRGAILSRARVTTVEGTLVHRMPVAFAGCRWNVGLGRSDTKAWGSFPGHRSHRRQEVSSGRMRRGTSSACAKRTHSSQAPARMLYEGGHVLHSVQRPVHVNRH